MTQDNETENVIKTKAPPQFEELINEIKICWAEREATLEYVLKLKDILDKTLHFIDNNREDFIDCFITITASSHLQGISEYLFYSFIHINIVEALLSREDAKDSTICKTYMSLLLEGLSWPIDGTLHSSDYIVSQKPVEKDCIPGDRFLWCCSDLLMLIASCIYNYKPSEEETGDYTALCDCEYLGLMAKRCSRRVVYAQKFYKKLYEPLQKAQTVLAIIQSLTEYNVDLAYLNRNEILNSVTETFQRLGERRKALEDLSGEIKLDFVETEPQGNGGQKTNKENMSMVNSKTNKENWEAIKKGYGISKRDFGKKINFVKDQFKKDVIFRDIEHAYILESEGFSKPALILAGGVVEELLRLYLEHKNIKPGGKYFNDFIIACENNNLLKRGVYRLSDSVRDFRNLIHLENEKSERETISIATAKGAVSAIFTIANDFQ